MEAGEAGLGRARPARRTPRAPARLRGLPRAAVARATQPGLGPCYAYLFVEYGRPMDWIPGISVIRPGVLVGIWALIAVLVNRQRPLPRPVKLMFGLLALMALHVPLAMRSEVANWTWAKDGMWGFTIVLVAGVLPLSVLPMRLDAVRRLLTAYVFLHIPTAINGLVTGGRGLSGWMGDENDLALALNAALGAGVYLLFETRSGLKRLLLAGTLVLLLTGVVMTNSRGGFVGLVMLAVYVLISGPHRGKLLVVVLACALGLFLFAPPAFWTELESLQTAAEPGDTGEERLYYWGIAWEMFLDHPIIGVGPNNFGIRSSEYMDPERTGWASHPWGRVAHSLYFTVLSELGLVGSVLFAAILVWGFRVRRRLLRRAREAPDDPAARSAALVASGTVAAIVSVLATGAFLSVFLYPVHWSLIGLLASLDAVAGRSEPLPDESSAAGRAA